MTHPSIHLFFILRSIYWTLAAWQGSSWSSESKHEPCRANSKALLISWGRKFTCHWFWQHSVAGTMASIKPWLRLECEAYGPVHVFPSCSQFSMKCFGSTLKYSQRTARRTGFLYSFLPLSWIPGSLCSSQCGHKWKRVARSTRSFLSMKTLRTSKFFSCHSQH